MATRNTPKSRQKLPKSRRKRSGPRNRQADFVVLDMLRKVADPRMSLSDLRKAGIHLSKPSGTLRERARKFLRKAQKATFARKRRKNA